MEARVEFEVKDGVVQHQVVLTWEAPANDPAAQYNVLRGTASGQYPDFFQNGTTPISGTTFTDTSSDPGSLSAGALTPGTTYFYVVQAVDPASGLSSPHSNEVSVTIPTPITPEAPTGLTGTAQ